MINKSIKIILKEIQIINNIIINLSSNKKNIKNLFFLKKYNDKKNQRKQNILLKYENGNFSSIKNINL